MTKPESEIIDKRQKEYLIAIRLAKIGLSNKNKALNFLMLYSKITAEGNKGKVGEIWEPKLKVFRDGKVKGIIDGVN